MPAEFRIRKEDTRIDLLKKRGLSKIQLAYASRHPLGMTNYFNSLIACAYGVNSAIFFNHVSFWIKHNEERKMNYFEDRYWTYGTLEFLLDQYFPYLSVSMLRTAIDKLLDDRIIIRGNFNKHGYDQTTWYSIDNNRVKRIFDYGHIDLLIL
ncbi:hypothetical protein [Pedobacter xixiisoli]|uniref:Uncharacterized protein n=2 Tax=Pedobacter xixiisoli TaxID=1476464 RepID=A0A286ACZ6_9SPHI|nr:hypothetical protein [Pedobacter xixiisoli]SOD19774.1 hypothetical protein SAMN06297358_3479 [Pedobacter xixiisoli]